jgi:hypothetical protein
LARRNVLMLAADADLLVLLIEGRAQASATVALRFGDTESVLLALLQVVVLSVAQERADLEWHSAGLETWKGSGTKGAGEDEGGFHDGVGKLRNSGWW